MGTVAEAAGRTLTRLGARHVFGLVGSGNFAVTNALTRDGATFVPSRHEAGAVTMADAYARVSGEVGICSVHQGPGLTNTMTGLTEAAKGRTPLVVLAADTASSALRSNFRIDQAGMVAAVGAIAERVYGPSTAVGDAARAYRRARLERRPVVLMLPLDVQAAECADAPPPPTVELPPARPSEAAVARAADLLARARRPLLIAGRGAALAGAAEPIRSLASRVGALLATSAVANGLFAGDRWSLGISGSFASPTAAELISSSDVVLGLGVALNMWTTRHGRLLGRDATVIQVDCEADAIGAHHRVDLGLLGDAAETALAIDAELERRGHRAEGWRSSQVAERIEAGSWSREPYEDMGTPDHIDPRTLSRLLDEVLPAERTVAIDSGHFMGWPAMYLRVPDARGFVFTQGFQAVGLGLASAIGAAIARPDRLAVAALGDGGLLMSASELETVARLGLRMAIIVYNDAAYGAEVHHFGPEGAPLDLVRFPDMDIAAMARGVGLEGVTLRRPEDIGAVAGWVRRGDSRALLVDAKVVPTVVAGWLEEAFGH